MMRSVANAGVVVLLVAVVGGLAFPTDGPDSDACAKYLYVPPDLARDVLVYQTFSQDSGEPEVNRLEAESASVRDRLASGLTGRGFVTRQEARGLTMQNVDLPFSRPLTVSFWFRLDVPMRAESAFHLISLHTSQGFISHFVRGKGEWCALKEPTFVAQLYNFAAISNVNGIDFGDGWLEENEWHHVALTVSEGSRIRVYWNGHLRGDIAAKGRLFHARDVIRSITVGPHSLGHPMTLDEILILGRALSADEIRSTIESVRKLREGGFPTVALPVRDKVGGDTR